MLLKLILILGIFLNTFPQCTENSGSAASSNTALSAVQAPLQSYTIMTFLPNWFQIPFFEPIFRVTSLSVYGSEYSFCYENLLRNPYFFVHIVGAIW
ncbi:MAG: hypothetical protein COY39_02450 [Alphaproteobacteria bacterium CG_4_10_14_0_8_um_filter_37_21]|nr:MAG: hypothetical protein COY39_02450 [Alphaproteobacteria bacterium CG_4_10_14_0_8_um_filter_37_21]